MDGPLLRPTGRRRPAGCTRLPPPSVRRRGRLPEPSRAASSGLCGRRRATPGQNEEAANRRGGPDAGGGAERPVVAVRLRGHRRRPGRIVIGEGAGGGSAGGGGAVDGAPHSSPAVNAGRGRCPGPPGGGTHVDAAALLPGLDAQAHRERRPARRCAAPRRRRRLPRSASKAPAPSRPTSPTPQITSQAGRRGDRRATARRRAAIRRRRTDRGSGILFAVSEHRSLVSPGGTVPGVAHVVVSDPCVRIHV